MSAALKLAPVPPSAALRVGVEEHLLSLALSGIPGLVRAIPPELRVEDFAGGWTRLVFEEVQTLLASDEPVTLEFVADRLRLSGRLPRVSFNEATGLEALRLLAAQANFVDGNISKVARKVVELAVSRRSADARERAGLRLANGDPIAEVFAELEASSTPTAIFHARPLVELIDAFSTRGPVHRLDTGIRSIDEATRGGFPLPRMTVLGGAPGAGKTSLATFLGYRWALRGINVGGLAVDEGPEGFVSRIAQMSGFSTEQLEENDPDEWARLRANVSELPLFVADDRSTVDDVARELAHRAKGAPAVLILDSLQKVRVEGEPSDRPLRELINARVDRIKALTERHGFLTLVTCELTRDSYKSRQTSDQVNDLAAFKESGSIEYAAKTAFVLRSVAGEGELVDVTTPKNRGARFGKPSFRLRMDRARATFDEVAMPEPEESTAEDPSQRARGAVLRLLASRHDLRSANTVVGALTGQGLGRGAVLEAVRHLLAQGLITNHTGGSLRLTSEVQNG